MFVCTMRLVWKFSPVPSQGGACAAGWTWPVGGLLLGPASVENSSRSSIWISDGPARSGSDRSLRTITFLLVRYILQWAEEILPVFYPKSSDDLSPMGLNLSKFHQSHAETEHDVFLTKIYPNVDIQLIHLFWLQCNTQWKYYLASKH